MTHSARAHARLSPSASKRWMECPGSVRLSEGIEQKSSVFADEGTAAHELCQHCLETGFDADRFGGQFIDITAKGAKRFIKERKHDRCFEIDDEMVESVQIYLDFCREFTSDHEIAIEQRLDLTHLYPDQFGTSDFTAYHPETQHLHVTDFKYGRGVAVDPRENSQGLCYASGAVKRHHNRGVKKISIHVVQPRAGGDPVRSWETTPKRLEEFEHVFRSSARATEQPDAPLNPGEWCRFCPAAAICEARQKANYEIAKADFGSGDPALPDVTKFDPDQIGQILSRIEEIESYCRRVREFAHDQALHGNMPTGFKLVAKRANRKWRNPEMVISMLPMLFDVDEGDLFEPRKLLSPAKIEAMLPGKNKAARAKEIDALVVKESAGTVLAPESDKRPPVKADAASEFGAVE